MRVVTLGLLPLLVGGCLFGMPRRVSGYAPQRSDRRPAVYAGMSRARAVEAAKAYVVRIDYRGDESLFYRNTGNRPSVVKQARDGSGQRAWFVRFDDFEAMKRNCVAIQRGSLHLITRGTAC